MNGPQIVNGGAVSNGTYMRPPTCGGGGVEGPGAPPVWVLQSGINNRRSLGSESDSGLTNNDR